MTVLVVGDLVTDVVAVTAGPLADGTDTPASIALTGGGAAANTAAWLAYAGTPVTLVAAVGEDRAGAERVAELEAAGVRCAVSRHPGATGTVVVVADGTERTMLTDRGANAYLAPADVDAGMPGASHLHLSGYPLFDPRTRPAGRHALAAARAAGLTVSVDAASAGPLRQVGPAAFLEWVRGADLLFANVAEARVLAGDADPDELARRLAVHVAAAIVKLGPDGASYAAGRHNSGASAGDRAGAGAGAGGDGDVAGGDGVVVRVAAVPARVVDVTGAGDAFAAGALTAWLAGRPSRQVLEAGARLAAEAVSRPGARPAH